MPAWILYMLMIDVLGFSAATGACYWLYGNPFDFKQGVYVWAGVFMAIAPVQILIIKTCASSNTPQTEQPTDSTEQ